MFIKLALLANLLVWTLAWWAMNKWLQDFEYHIDIYLLWVLVWSGVAAIVIALLTIGFQAIKAAIANPVQALCNE